MGFSHSYERGCSSMSNYILCMMRSSYSQMKEYLHPNLVNLYRYCCGTRLALVFDEEFTGLVLSDVLLSDDFGWDERMRVATQLADLYSCLHENNIALDRLTPANIMIDKEFNIKVFDFGYVTNTFNVDDSFLDDARAPEILVDCPPNAGWDNLPSIYVCQSCTCSSSQLSKTSVIFLGIVQTVRIRGKLNHHSDSKNASNCIPLTGTRRIQELTNNTNREGERTRIMKSDVYFFGILLLELIAKRKFSFADECCYVQTSFANAAKRGKKYLVHECFTEVDYPTALAITLLVFLCTDFDPDKRPSMKDVIDTLNVLGMRGEKRKRDENEAEQEKCILSVLC